MKRLIIPLFFLGMFLLSGCRSTSELETISGFEIDRYLGPWYEAARFPHRFEKGLIAVTAEYSLNEDGSIRVLNRGFDPLRNEWKEAKGKAKFRGNPGEGRLKVSFFGPFYAAYNILYLDDAYTEAIITGPSYDYLWILTRQPSLPDERLEQLIHMAKEFGFDITRIERIDQRLNM